MQIRRLANENRFAKSILALFTVHSAVVHGPEVSYTKIPPERYQGSDSFLRAAWLGLGGFGRRLEAQVANREGSVEKGLFPFPRRKKNHCS